MTEASELDVVERLVAELVELDRQADELRAVVDDPTTSRTLVARTRSTLVTVSSARVRTLSAIDRAQTAAAARRHAEPDPAAAEAEAAAYAEADRDTVAYLFRRDA